MRIVGGRWRGRRLLPPEDETIRPTSDRLRERVFNILSHHEEARLDGALVLDLFAGTGALGLEALSRGAARVVFVDIGAQARRLIQAMIQALGAADRATILACPADRLPPAEAPADLLFLDPPYARDLATPALACAVRQGWLGPQTLAVLEQRKTDRLELPPGLEIRDRRTQGLSQIVFLRRIEHG